MHFFYDEEKTLIHKLVELQTIDTKLKDINDLLGDLPSRVKELDQQEDTIKANLENFRNYSVGIIALNKFGKSDLSEVLESMPKSNINIKFTCPFFYYK